MSGQRGGLHTVGNYTLLEVVGQGTFGEVWSAVERHTRESVAVKILEKEKIVDDDARQRLVNEIAILQRVQHNNLVQLLEVIEEPDRIYLVTEYVGGGELFSYIVQKGRLDEVEAARLFAQMVAAVDSCHRQLVIHRDLKPENVLLDSNGDIKVIDFGLGTLLNYTDEVLTVACGSPHYAAPEMLLGGGYLGQRADMWSLGVCLYAMVCGCLPFDEPEMEVLYDRIIAGEYDFSPNPALSHAAKDLICGLLRSPPEDRLTAREVLAHKWMRQVSDMPVRGGAAALSLGLVGAVVDPACKMLSRKMEAEYGISQREVVESLRRGERSPVTATYWLLRQRELRLGNIQRYAAHLPRPPPPRAPSQRRRPVPSHIRAAAAKLPAVAAAQSPPSPPSLGPMSALGGGGKGGGGGGGGSSSRNGGGGGHPNPHIAAMRHAADSPFSSAANSPYSSSGGSPHEGRSVAYRRGDGSSTQRGVGRFDDGGKGGGGGGGPLGGVAPLVHRQRDEAPLYVHASGALTDRTDRDGHSRRLHELEAGPVRRAGVGVGGGRVPGVGVGTARESHVPSATLTQITDIAVTGSGRSSDRRDGPPSSRVGGGGGAGFIESKLSALGFGNRGSSSPGRASSHSARGSARR